MSGEGKQICFAKFLEDISTLIQKTQPKLVRPISIAFDIYLASSHTPAFVYFPYLNIFSNGSDISAEWVPVNSWEYQL